MADGEDDVLLHPPSVSVLDQVRACVSDFSRSLSSLSPALSLAARASVADVNSADEYFRALTADGTAPPELLALFTICDGQEFSSAGVIGNWSLLSSRLVIQEHRTLKALNDARLLGAARWRDEWIPFAQSPSGHYLLIDTTTSAHAVILFLYDDAAAADERVRVADDLLDFFARATAAVTAGRIVYNADLCLFDGDSDGFNCVWRDASASSAYRSRRETELQTFDETTLNALTRIDN